MSNFGYSGQSNFRHFRRRSFLRAISDTVFFTGFVTLRPLLGHAFDLDSDEDGDESLSVGGSIIQTNDWFDEPNLLNAVFDAANSAARAIGASSPDIQTAVELSNWSYDLGTPFVRLVLVNVKACDVTLITTSGYSNHPLETVMGDEKQYTDNLRLFVEKNKDAASTNLLRYGLDSPVYGRTVVPSAIMKSGKIYPSYILYDIPFPNHLPRDAPKSGPGYWPFAVTFGRNSEPLNSKSLITIWIDDGTGGGTAF